MKQTLLLIGYRAFGDWLYASPLIPLLTDKYDVVLETSTKGYLLLCDDTRFKKVLLFNDFEGKPRSDYEAMFKERWEKIRDQVKPDLEINLNGTLEVECIAENFQEEFYWPVGERRAFYGKNGFYDSILKRAGIPMPEELRLDGLFFHPDQEEHVLRWREKHKGKFVVVIGIAGSTAQKVFHGAGNLAQALVDRYPEAVVLMAGDEPCHQYVPSHPRIHSMCGDRVAIKQAVHMMKHVDMVIGPETCLLVAAGMFGTPKIILATTSSVWQMTQYQKNDFSIQAPVPCSPCHRAIYFDTDCETPIRDKDGAFVTPTCSKSIRIDDLMQRVEYVHRLWEMKTKVGTNEQRSESLR